MSQLYVKTHTGAHAQSGLNPTVSVVAATGGNHFRLNIRYSSNGRSVVSISDGSNTWHNPALKTTDGGTNNGQELWYAENVAAGTYTVTLTMDSVTATNIEVFIDEFSGTATSNSFDQSAIAGATTGASPLAIGPTGVTTQANENVYTCASVVNGANARPLTNPPTGYTADANGQVNGNANQFCSAHLNVAATGTQSTSWAWTGGTMNSTAILATFKDAAGGGGGGSGGGSISVITDVVGL